MDYLCHHGIKGQRWGERNGPPYPLTDSQKSNSKSYLGNGGAIVKRKVNNKTPLNKRPISKKEQDEYRSEMLKRYSNNPKKQTYYKNATNSELKNDIYKKQQIRKNLYIASGVLGASVGLYVAYRCGIFDELKGLNVNDITDDIIKGTAYNVADEMDLVLSPGSSLDRMVAFKDFDVNNASGPLFVSFEKNDVNAYKLFLQDFSGTGERYHVQMQAVKDIVAPNREHTKEIFDKFRDNATFNECLAKLYGDKIGKHLTGEDVRNFGDNKFFDVAMWSLAKPGMSTDMLIEEARTKGYNAFRDYHDIDGKFTKTPLILINAKDDIIKTGESFVTENDRRIALKELNKSLVEMPISARAATFGTSIINAIPGSELSSFFGMKSKL